MPTVIVAERPDSADAMALIAELEAVLSPQYAPESRHGFNVEKLLRQGVAFFVIRVDGAAAGCGGITGVTPLTLYRDWIAQTARQWGAGL